MIKLLIFGLSFHILAVIRKNLGRLWAFRYESSILWSQQVKKHHQGIQKSTSKSLKKECGIYKLNCNNCEAIYVGQTKRQLKTRIVEHRNHIKRNTFHTFRDH